MRRLWLLASMWVGLSAPSVAQEGDLAVLRAAATALRDDWLGHSYIYTSARAIDDLQTIIAEHAQPAEPPRIWLEGRSLPPDYWAFD